MTAASTIIAAGEGWRVSDIVCTAGPDDRPYEEQHDDVSLALVRSGVFSYRGSHGSALMTQGAVLLGNRGACFECGHDHSAGDRCLSLQFEPAYWEELVAATAGARRATFERPSLPPLDAVLDEALALQSIEPDAQSAVEERVIAFAQRVLGQLGDGAPATREPTGRIRRMVCEAAQRMERAIETGCEHVSLAALSREAGVSRFSFLRAFRDAIGVTPHQYLLRLRLGAAARRLIESNAPVTTIALDAGFNDLSTFNRRFRRAMGVNPSAYRLRARRRS